MRNVHFDMAIPATEQMQRQVVGNANFLAVNADWEDFIEKVQADPKDRQRDSYVWGWPSS